jgi:hypothetical protein
VRLYAALRDGETAELTVTGTPMHVRVADHDGYPWPDTPADAFGDVVAELAASPATFRASWSSWYELALTVPAASSPAVCFAVHPTRSP